MALSGNYPVNVCKQIAKYFMIKPSSDDALSFLMKARNEREQGVVAAKHRYTTKRPADTYDPELREPKRPTLEPAD
eukprot:4658299-Pyramimonas_sp.AAC.1